MRKLEWCRWLWVVVGIWWGACSVPPTGEQDLTRSSVAVTGLRAYRDPITGQFGASPPSAVAPAVASPARAMSSSSSGLSEEPSAGGGRLVRLQGRFHNLITASTGAGGIPRVGCAGAPAPVPGPGQ